MVDAAEQVIRTRGLSRTTTKEIARIADCSEGSLYNHFQSKEYLIIQVIKRQLTDFLAVLFKLPGRKGTRTVKENLEELAHAALQYYDLSITLTASMFTEPVFLTRHREQFERRNEGPHRANEIVATYLQAEQKLGIVSADMLPGSAADLLLGACFQHAFHLQFLGHDESTVERQWFAGDALQTLMKGLLP